MSQLNYPGNCRDIEGQIVGPTINKQLLTVMSTYYDAELDRTEAFTRPATTSEVEAVRALWTPPAAYAAKATVEEA